MSKLIGLSCLLVFKATYAVAISLCDASSYLEVKEGQNNTFVCTELTANQNVDWIWPSDILSTCTTTSCSNKFPEYFQISRTKTTSSEVTVYASIFPNLDYLATTSLSCQQGSGANKVTCQLDVVYPAEDPKCQIEFSGDTWEVTGWCNVSKVRSRRDRYGCYLYQYYQQSSSTLVGNFIMSTKPLTRSNYSFGNCQIKTSLPPEGTYNYSVMIIPGGVEVFPSFNGSNEIRRPSEPLKHNCPQTVTEGEDVDCVCSSDHLGLPSGYVMWTRTSSSKLKIEKVNRTYDSTSNICVLMWNNTAVQTVAYSMTVNYASRVTSFKIDSKTEDVVNVDENRNVSVVCEAEGRPPPNITLFKKGSDNQIINIYEANNVYRLVHTINVVNCEDAYSYSCKSENSISADQRHKLLTVSCSPKKTTNDSYFTTFADGKASLTLKMNAYPSPKLLSIFYNGSGNNSMSRKIEHENTVTSTCSSDTSHSYIITCTVTLLNQTIYETGFYTVTFSNALGNISFVFEIILKLQTTTTDAMKITDSPGLSPGPIIGGVIGGVVFIVLTVLIIIFVVRRKGKSKQSPSLPNNAVEEDFSEEQNNRAETPKEVYAIVEKKDPKPTTASTTMDVYADVKKGTEITEVDSTASTLTPTPEKATKDKKRKISKTPGKGKKKGKGDKKLLAANKTEGALSMTPMTESEYENCGFDGNEQGKETKGAKEVQRRYQQGLNYTTVVFDNTTTTPTPPPVLETTEYAEIVPRQKPTD